ncbi:stalk domain-containing protein [Paenibacillus sp. RC67]|uniref:stalk domain-containing protein n=1 Tax=Paenibacillus sp. RC67 TaxID=3039392 RepID=UPI0024ADE000|nr:stalk domain-containing protein [Paenibacillus sp. RC67]
MKKISFIAGLCAGIGLSLCTAAFASDSIQARLFPSKVHFLVNGAVKEIDGADDNAVLNYNNKAYIPLRTFAEAIGATVNYRQSNEGKDNIIDIYAGKSAEDFNTQDKNGYISLANVITEPSENQTPGYTDLTVKCLLRVDKDLSGKKIQLDILDQAGTVIGSTDADFWNKLQLGDIIPLNLTIHAQGDMHSYQVRVRDSWSMTTTTGYYDGMLLLNQGLVFGMGQLDKEKKGLVQLLQFKNQGKQPIRIEPLNIEYQIVKVEAGGEQLMFSQKLAPLVGTIPVYAWYEAKLPVWNLTDPSGNPVTPGKYAAQIIIPDSLQYWTEGSSEPQVLTSTRLSRVTRWEYDIHQSDIDTMH